MLIGLVFPSTLILLVSNWEIGPHSQQFGSSVGKECGLVSDFSRRFLPKIVVFFRMRSLSSLDFCFLVRFGGLALVLAGSV